MARKNISRYFIDTLPITNTENTDLTLYIDGKDYFSDLTSSLRQARNWVFMTGLHFMADFALIRNGTHVDKENMLVNILKKAVKDNKNLKIYLLVNQFWEDEQAINDGNTFDPIRKIISDRGNLRPYLGLTLDFFDKLKSESDNIYCRTEIHPHYLFGTNHQKTVVIDNEIAYLGGIDLTYLDGDRWDSPNHGGKTNSFRKQGLKEKNWHDIHMRVGHEESKEKVNNRAYPPSPGVVAFVRDNFVQRWMHGFHMKLANKSTYVYRQPKGFIGPAYLPSKILKLEPAKKKPPLPKFPEPEIPKNFKYCFTKGNSVYCYPNHRDNYGTSTVQIVRSMPWSKTYLKDKPKWNQDKSKRWERGCKDAYLLGISSAKKYIYLENQWLSDEQIWKALYDALRNNINNSEFRIIIMLPYNPLFSAGAGANQDLFIKPWIRKLYKLASGKHALKFGMYSLLSNDGKFSDKKPPAQIYIHSKVLIVDDKWCLIGSANSGGISLNGIRIYASKMDIAELAISRRTSLPKMRRYHGADQPDTELSAIILDNSFVSNFRKKLWREHLGKSVGDKYDIQDVDYFRTQAKKPHNKVRFFPKYNEVSRTPSSMEISSKIILPTPLKVLEIDKVSLKKYSEDSRILCSFPREVMDGYIAPTFTAAGFHVRLPSIQSIRDTHVPHYRWSGILFPKLTTKSKLPYLFKLSGASYGKPSMDKYSRENFVYISDFEAKEIEKLTTKPSDGLITCTVEFVPKGKQPNHKHSRIILNFKVIFVNLAYAETQTIYKEFLPKNGAPSIPWLMY